MNIPARIRAVIFDLDGVLTDSEPLINAAAVAMFKEQGLVVQPADFLPFVGAGEDRYIGGVAEKYGFPLDLSSAKRRTYEIYLELVPDRLQAFPGAQELVRRCQQAGLKVAVASSADLIKIVANLRKIGLPPENWDAIVCAEDVKDKKPAPDIFLAAARKLHRENDVIIVGQGADRRVREELKKPEARIIGSTVFSPEKYGESVIPLALRILRGDRLDTTMNYRLRDAVVGLMAPQAFDSKGFADSGYVIKPTQFAARLASMREDYPDAAYYSLMNLAKAYILTRGIRSTLDQARHGLSEKLRASKRELVDAYLEVYPSPGRNGPNVFADFWQAVSGKVPSAKLELDLPYLLPQIVAGHRLW